ncbi:xanthine dehydrogenase family protein molybdopterin-binding subunit [Xenophilus arseniciresistens]|uniref:Xanthine dehydrogenase family protein molybdopterin-binding subunit n=1 Tax=Xenophilus arseniciresistens TaxID=1283306 RepID=A0AAE3SXZ9_9BURK|nr:aldehyde oxidoreductase molybdenum-binding subunit PaoC [Xenophilus arseniciresistens]MDA7415010.1 xanthine dehydrogenase family protein molybdopterin-binding subunit [Xenophilus arseniciresistens]
MKFDAHDTVLPDAALQHLGQPTERVDGARKATGSAPYAGEWQEEAPDAAFGWVLGAGIAKGRIAHMDLEAARAAPGVLAIVTADSAGPLHKASRNTARLLGGPAIAHYHQAIAVVMAGTLEQARAAAALIDVRYEAEPGRFDLAQARADAPLAGEGALSEVGDFDGAFAQAEVRIDASYCTSDESHAMMEPHATLAAWHGDALTVWTSTQMVDWCRTDLAQTLGLPKHKVHVRSPFIGGGFGGKLFLRADALLAALGARAAGRPVKLALQRPLVINNTTHRPATIQRVRLGAQRDGRLTAIAHESWSGDQPGGQPETAVNQTRLLYAGANRRTAMYLAQLDLPEGNSMRAPGEAPGMMALEVAMDELAQRLDMDPVELRLRNDTDVDPEHPQRRFTQRRLADCLREGAGRFGWHQRVARPGAVREGEWAIGLGMAAAFRNHLMMKSAARVRLDAEGRLTVQTDMTDIGTGSYTILAQTAADLLGLPLARVEVKLGDSDWPVSAGSGGQFGAANATGGVYAACMKLRETLARKLGLDPLHTDFKDGCACSQGRRLPIEDAVGPDGAIVAEDGIDYDKSLSQQWQHSTFGAHFVEVAVHVHTREIRVRRMLAVCAAGRILNPLTARSQVIGAMTMGVGAALMETLAVDTRHGLFINHDLAGYEVPVHADIPSQEVVFLPEPDPMASPLQAKGIAELGLCGAAAAVANAVYNATGVRVRSFPVTLDKLLAH